jgi:ubiquinone biosynthesis protein
MRVVCVDKEGSRRAGAARPSVDLAGRSGLAAALRLSGCLQRRRVPSLRSSSAEMDVTDFLLSLPIIVLLSWLASRLIALRQSWLATVTIGIVGWLLGASLAVRLTSDSDGTLKRLATQLFFAIVFMVAVQGALELLRRPDLRDRRPPRPGLPHPMRALRTAASRSQRYSQIVRIAMRNGFGPHLGRGQQGANRPQAKGTYGHRLRLTLEESGGTFVKLGQMLSSRSELLPPDVVSELSHLQDDVAPAPPEAITALIEREIGRPLASVFRHFDTEPIGAASIAQVHAAILVDGREVVVKVQRPGIDELVERDLDALLRLARSIERRAPWARPYQIGALAGEFADRLRDELDFRLEAASTSTIARNLETSADIHIPEVHAELSTRRILTLEKLRGVSVRDGDEIDRRGLERQELADRLVGCYLRQLLVDGVYHADPHAGNILVLDESRIGLIDFGAVGRLDAVQQEALKEMLLAIGRRDPEAVLTAVLDVVDIPANTDLGRLQHALASFLARHVTATVTPSVGAFTALLRILIGFGVYIPPEFSTLFRALATLQGTVETLAPGYEFAARVEAAAVALFHDPGTAPGQTLVKSELARTLPQLRRLPRHLDRIATLAERGDLRLRVSLFSTESDVQAITRLLNRVILAGLGVGIAIVAIGLLRTPGGPYLANGLRLYPSLAYLGLLTSMVFIVRVTVAVMRDGLN